ncbi:esterase-like activity of phytase family protein [Candidatus Poribacteria bacterium]
MHRSIVIATIMSFVLLIGITLGEDSVYPLKLIKVLPIEYSERVDLSGLTIFGDKIYTVSDKHDDTIFQVKLTDCEAILVPHIRFRVPPPVSEQRLDFEGITCDEKGNFYLASETRFRVLRVDAEGEDASWVTPSIEIHGREVGLFQTEGAYIEGIALTGDGRLVLCAERQPRGIIDVDISQTPCEIRALKCDTTKIKFPENRPLDFTGLFWEREALFVLQRNAYAISELAYNDQSFEEKNFWSYDAIVTSERYRYSDMTYGRAEGLCMNEEKIFVILDNNGDCGYSNPQDCRPLLLIMERP